MSDRLRDGEIAHAGLDPRGAILDVDLENAIELREAEENSVGEGKGAAGKPGTGSAGHHRDALSRAEAEYLLDLLGGLGQHRHHGKLAVGGEPVALVGAKPLFVVQNAFGGQDASKFRDERIRTDIGHLLAPHPSGPEGPVHILSGWGGTHVVCVSGPLSILDDSRDRGWTIEGLRAASVGFSGSAEMSSSRSPFVARTSRRQHLRGSTRSACGRPSSRSRAPAQRFPATFGVAADRCGAGKASS